jgi:hypothetical protein
MKYFKYASTLLALASTLSAFASPDVKSSFAQVGGTELNDTSGIHVIPQDVNGNPVSFDEATQITYKVCSLDDSNVCSEDIGTYSKDYVQLRAEQLTAEYQHKWRLAGKHGTLDFLSVLFTGKKRAQSFADAANGQSVVIKENVQDIADDLKMMLNTGHLPTNWFKEL